MGTCIPQFWVLAVCRRLGKIGAYPCFFIFYLALVRHSLQDKNGQIWVYPSFPCRGDITPSVLIYHPIPQLGEYKMHLRCCLCRQFTWNCVRPVCQENDGRRNCRQKRRIGSLSIVFAWQVWTFLFGASG